MAVCAGIKRDGARCSATVPPGVEWCYGHDPRRSEERRRNASRAGRASSNREIKELKNQLSELYADVLAGRVPTAAGAVANQILNTRLRALSLERDIREQEELLERIEMLEEGVA
ncbi:MAG: hypothetical protein M3N45_00960 [Actinomycetota bacterium]|nr:hypothetical protein [Actinomycetota bacterium]